MEQGKQLKPYYKVTLEEGKSYAWCSCGLTKKQPFCDGSHTGTGKVPMVFKCDKNKEVALCGCKKTRNQPYCDGSHK